MSQPEAIRLSRALLTSGWELTQQEKIEAAEELRRLHKENRELRRVLYQLDEDDDCVAIVNEGMGGIEWVSKPLPDDTPLYTAPPKREPLMTKYVIDLWDEYGNDPIKFAREIEKMHGIKENT